MKESRFIDKFAYDPTKWKGEINKGPYLVEPNQAMSLRDIFEKFRLGIPIGDHVREAVYNDTDEMPRYDIDQMDLMDEMSAIERRVKPANVKRNEMKQDSKDDEQGAKVNDENGKE